MEYTYVPGMVREDKVIKIVFFSNSAWSLLNYRYGLMKTLKNMGFEVIGIAPYDESVPDIKKEFPFVTLINFYRKSLNPFVDFKAIVELYQVYKRIKPDIVFHYTIKPNIYGSLVSRLLNINCCNVITGLTYSLLNENSLNILGRILYKFVLCSGKKAVFQNYDDLNVCLLAGIVENNKAIVIKSSGVNTDYFSARYCKNTRAKDEGFFFLFIARILWYKGAGEFVEACRTVRKLFPMAEGWMVGAVDEGKKSAVNREQINEWEAEGIIRYFGITEDVRSFICKCDVMVLPSYREGTPRTLLEAMAMERPIITTDTAGCRQTVDDGINGFLVPVKDSKSLSDAMIKCVNMSEDARTRMGVLGREKVLREFDERLVIESYIRLTDELLSI